MLQLFKEQDRQNELIKGDRRRKLDISMQERFRGFNMKDSFNEHLFRGENIRSDLKDAMQAMQIKNCKKNLFLCEESLSKELGEMKLKIQREEKLRQLLWERNPELRELRQNFLMANVTRDQMMQIAEKQALIELKRLEEKSLAEEAQRQKEAMEAEERKKEMAEFQARLKHHKDLDDLRLFKLSRESSSGNEREMERNAIDDILKKIKEENMEAERKRLEKQKAFYEQTQEFLKVREGMRRQQKYKDQVDELRADEYRKAQELRAKEQSERKQLCLEQRLQIQEKLLSYLETLCSEKLREELLRTELAVEEKEAYERGRDHESEIKKMKIRQDLQQLYEMQIRVKKQREDLQKKEEELYRQNLMAKLYEQDKLELMSQQKRHLKKMEHLRVARAMIEENRKRKAMEHARELADQKYQESLESERARMVNEEKIRFLRDNASELLGYLPKGIFQSNETVELMGDEIKKFYSRQACTK